MALLDHLPFFLRRRLQPPGPRPYANFELEDQDCFRCSLPAETQWQVCADGNTYRPLCRSCDLALNSLVLEWMGHPERDHLMAQYTVEMTQGGRHG